jgi:hypothetical protein
MAEELTPERLGQFLERLPDFERKLAAFRQDGNTQILAALDGLLAQAIGPGRDPLEDTMD